jgi:FKBP-type peptidyl-prolyl cis-trans isomerase FklB
MKKYSIVIAASLLVLATASVARSQAPPQQQPGTAPSRPAAGAAAPAAGQTALPAPPAGTAPGAIDQKQVSYALGRTFAMNLKASDIPFDLPSLFAGIQDAASGAQPKYTDEQLGATMKQFMLEMRQKQMVKAQQQVAKNQKVEADFLAKNKAKPGVQTTASGLQYKVIQEGKGPSPTMGDTVKCNYKGVLIDGTEFDNSQAHGGPAEFRIGEGLIPGWIEALQKMKVGDKWELYVPSALAYDMEPPGEPIEPGSALIFEIELLGIQPQQQQQ